MDIDVFTSDDKNIKIPINLIQNKTFLDMIKYEGKITIDYSSKVWNEYVKYLKSGSIDVSNMKRELVEDLFRFADQYNEDKFMFDLNYSSVIEPFYEEVKIKDPLLDVMYNSHFNKSLTKERKDRLDDLKKKYMRELLNELYDSDYLDLEKDLMKSYPKALDEVFNKIKLDLRDNELYPIVRVIIDNYKYYNLTPTMEQFFGEDIYSILKEDILRIAKNEYEKFRNILLDRLEHYVVEHEISQEIYNIMYELIMDMVPGRIGQFMENNITNYPNILKGIELKAKEIFKGKLDEYRVKAMNNINKALDDYRDGKVGTKKMPSYVYKAFKDYFKFHDLTENEILIALNDPVSVLKNILNENQLFKMSIEINKEEEEFVERMSFI